MNHWASMLAELPVLGQRLVARHQRISLPRGCSADMRHARLRHALCHAATVRATYVMLDEPTQLALQELRARRGGIDPADLVQHYGALRSWTQLVLDPQPRTIAERLLLLGWLLPRPARPHHPARYLLPPELRRWLPQPLRFQAFGPAPAPPFPPALFAVATLLILATEHALPIRRDGRLRHAARREIAQRLPMLDGDDAAAVTLFVLPLLYELGCVATHANGLRTTLAGQQFLALSPAEQLARLQHTWLTAHAADHWLTPLLPRCVGIDWPYLRRRLWHWASALPVGECVDPESLYDTLAATFGPLADAHTHGFRAVDRVPWQPRRAAQIWDAALRGPLRWLGLSQWVCPPSSTANPHDPSVVVARCRQPVPAAAHQWHYGAPGIITIPYTTLDARVLALLPFAHWQAADATTTTYAITARSFARAVAAGERTDRLWATLETMAGPIPTIWRATLDATPTASVCFASVPVLLVEPPALLDRAVRARTVRRYVKQRPAPGIALVESQHVAALTRALHRQAIPVTHVPSPAAPRQVAPAPLNPGEAAALLVACAFYRRHAPPTAPLLPHLELEQRLSAHIPPTLRQATDVALAQLCSPPSPHPGVAPNNSQPLQQTLRALRHAVTMQHAVTISYYTAGRDVWTERVVRPLTLEQHDAQWYLTAYCTARQAERTFRVDRIGAIHAGAGPTRGVNHTPMNRPRRM